jgi:hypothetical protein
MLNPHAHLFAVTSANAIRTCSRSPLTHLSLGHYLTSRLPPVMLLQASQSSSSPACAKR